MQHNTNNLGSRIGSVMLLMIAMASIQSGAALATTLFPRLGPGGTTTIRLILAAFILALVLRPWRTGHRPLTARSWRAIIFYGLALGLMNFFFYQAVARLPLGIVVSLEFTGPLAVTLLASRRGLDIGWIALAVAGLATLLWPRQAAAQDLNWTGIVFALGAATCWGGYILFGQKAGSHHGTRSVALGTVVAALAIAPLGVHEAGSTLLSPTILVLGLAVAILSTALPYTLEMMALPKLPTPTFGTLMSLEPAFGALSGLVFLGQQLSWLQWAAIAAIVAASIGTTLTPPPR